MDWPGGEHRLSRILDDAGAGIFLLDGQGRFVQTNAALCHRLGYAPGELDHHHAMDLLDARDAEPMGVIFREMADGRRTHCRLQIRYRRKDGSIFWGDMAVNAIAGSGGKPEALIGVVIDINDQKKAEAALRAEKEKYRRMFDKSGAASIIIEADMIISMANEEFEKLTGFSREEIEHRMKWSDFVTPEDLERMMSYHVRRRIPDPEVPDEYECRIINRAGEVRDIFIKVGMLPDGIQSIASFMDITKRKLAEKALLAREDSLRRENVRLKSSIKDRFRFGDIIGRSPAMQKVYALILSAAATDANVIITGESGTGKELVAQAVHNMSDRRKAAFVAVHCGAIPDNLLESEFFGYKKGAFTGAAHDKHGYLDLADGGTLFLDELGEIGPAMQVKLLRVIEGMGYRPVGGETMRHPDVRIIAATNRDLAEGVRQGRIREDFYYRVHVIPIHLPPLRERKEDIPLLIDHFMGKYGNPESLPPITGKMLDAALGYAWPGNVRELQNVMHRFISLGRFDLSETPLKTPPPHSREAGAAPETSPPEPSASLPESVDAYERDLIRAALSRNQWHRGRAAADLGIHRRTLFKKIKKYRLDHSSIENDRS